MTLPDPLAKPEWPAVDADTGDTAAGLLGNLIAPLANVKPESIPDLYESVLVGFNSVMAGVEEHAQGGRKMHAIFVCRGDLPPEMCFPFALSSSALDIKLVSLPKGSRSKLSGAAGREAGIIGIREGDFGALKQTISDIGPARTNWAYTAVPQSKPKSTQSKPKGAQSAPKATKSQAAANSKQAKADVVQNKAKKG